jgi:hypothetical protein
MIVVCVGGHVEKHRCAAAAVDRDQGTGSKQFTVVSEGRAGGQAATWQAGSDTDGRHGHALHGQAVIPNGKLPQCSPPFFLGIAVTWTCVAL